MSTFKSISVVKFPPAVVCPTIRDRLPDLVPLLDDIEQVTVAERKEEPDGRVCLVNFWKAKLQIPAILASAVTPDAVAWTDRAEWSRAGTECRWRIEPRFYPELTRCTGITHYEPALGGRGTRITFEGEFGLAANTLPNVPGLLGGTVGKGIESFATTLIPQNFRKLAHALETFLGQQA